MFGKEVSCKIKGITAIVVILFHLVFSISDMPVYNIIFHDVGYLCVGIFFFISGYGMALKLNADKNYISIYIKDKVPRLLIPYLEIFFIYWIGFKIMKTPDMGVVRVLLSLVNGHSIVEYSWYVYAVILFDLCLCFIFMIKNNKVRIGIVIILLLSYCIVMYMQGMGDEWIRSCSAYVFGIFCACYPCVTDWLIRHRKVAVILCAAELFGRMIKIPQIESVARVYPIHILFSWLDCICLCTIIIVISDRISKRKNIFTSLGEISYELYLIHGLVILMLRNTKWHLNPSWLMILCTLVLSVIIAYIWHRFNVQVWRRRR